MARESIMTIAKAAHAPFISHPAEFCSALIAFSHEVPTLPETGFPFRAMFTTAGQTPSGSS